MGVHDVDVGSVSLGVEGNKVHRPKRARSRDFLYLALHIALSAARSEGLYIKKDEHFPGSYVLQ